jgi:hypothetical protein
MSKPGPPSISSAPEPPRRVPSPVPPNRWLGAASAMPSTSVSSPPRPLAVSSSAAPSIVSAPPSDPVIMSLPGPPLMLVATSVISTVAVSGRSSSVALSWVMRVGASGQTAVWVSGAAHGAAAVTVAVGSRTTTLTPSRVNVGWLVSPASAV